MTNRAKSCCFNKVSVSRKPKEPVPPVIRMDLPFNIEIIHLWRNGGVTPGWCEKLTARCVKRNLGEYWGEGLASFVNGTLSKTDQNPSPHCD
jgi:hypothetical protein